MSEISLIKIITPKHPASLLGFGTLLCIGSFYKDYQQNPNIYKFEDNITTAQTSRLLALGITTQFSAGFVYFLRKALKK